MNAIFHNAFIVFADRLRFVKEKKQKAQEVLSCKFNRLQLRIFAKDLSSKIKGPLIISGYPLNRVANKRRIKFELDALKDDCSQFVLDSCADPVSILISCNYDYYEIESILNDISITDYNNFELILICNFADGNEFDKISKLVKSYDLQVIFSQASGNYYLSLSNAIIKASGVLILLFEKGFRPLSSNWLNNLAFSLYNANTAVTSLLVGPGNIFKLNEGRVLESVQGGYYFWDKGLPVYTNIASKHGVVSDSVYSVPCIGSGCMLFRRSDYFENMVFCQNVTQLDVWTSLCFRMLERGRISCVSNSVLFTKKILLTSEFDKNESLPYAQNLPTTNAQLFKRNLAFIFNGEAAYSCASEKLLVLLGRKPSIFQLLMVKSLMLSLNKHKIDVVCNEYVKENPLESGLVVSFSSRFDPSIYSNRIMSIGCIDKSYEVWTNNKNLVEYDLLILVLGSGEDVSEKLLFYIDAIIENDSGEALFKSIMDLSLRKTNQPKLNITFCSPDKVLGKYWGDTFFTNDFRVACKKNFFVTSFYKKMWASKRASCCEVALHIRGREANIDNFNDVGLKVLWMISHPDCIDKSELDYYDIIFVASYKHAEKISQKYSRDILPLLQATRFSHQFRCEPSHIKDILFVGNTRGQRRKSVIWAIEAGYHVDVYGSGWSGIIPAKYIKGVSFPNETLDELYRQYKVVLNDHWDDMRSEGFISNRVFDVLGAGGLVLSDYVDSMDEIFQSKLPTFKNRVEFLGVLKLLLDSVSYRVSLKQALNDIVRSEHLFVHRAEEFNHYIDVNLVN